MSNKDKFFSYEAFNGIIQFLIKGIPTYILAMVLKKNQTFKNISLICERPDEAHDNGAYLFTYIRKHYPEEKVYYAIKKKSLEVPNISSVGNILWFGSYNHYLIYFLARKHISSHGAGTGCMPNLHACTLINKLFNNKYNLIYLKHGIVKDFMPHLVKEKAKLDLIFCGGSPEFKYVLKNFGYTTDVVKYTGLARFDGLIDNSEKNNQIFYFPTWRKWLDHLNENEFIKTKYYKKIVSLINSSELQKVLEDNDTTFCLFLHPRMKKYTKKFQSIYSKVIILNPGEVDIQSFLKNSNLLITDYSSVFFDFCFMEKPVLYYQFDYAEYREKHYSEGYFDYVADGFGRVFVEEAELIINIQKIIGANYFLEEKYLKRISNFFKLKDYNNCERIFNEIKLL